MTMTNEELAEAVARLNKLQATSKITEMYLVMRQLWEEREQHRAAMAQAKEALIGWESRNGGMHTRSDDGRKALAALESMGV